MSRIIGLGFIIVTCLSFDMHAAGKSAAQLAAEKQREEFGKKTAEAKRKAVAAKNEKSKVIRSTGKTSPDEIRQQVREPAAGQETPLSSGAKIGLTRVERGMKAGHEEYVLQVPVTLSNALRDAALGNTNKVTLVAYFLSKFADTTTTHSEYGFYMYERTVKERGYIVGRIAKNLRLETKINNPTTIFLIAECVNAGMGEKDNIDVSGHYVELLVDGARVDTRLQETDTSVDNLKRKYGLPNEWWLQVKDH